MPPGEEVGRAYVVVDVDASPGKAELDSLMAKADRDFAELGRKKAVAELGIKSADFDAKIDDAKKQLDYLKGRRATATLDLAKKHFDEEIEAAKAQLKDLSSKKATITVDTRQVTAANKATKLLADARALDEKHALGQAKAENKLATERSRATMEAAKARVEIGRLSDQYEKLLGRQKAIQKSSGGVFSSKSIATAEKERRSLGRVGDELELTKTRIESMGGSVDGLEERMNKNSSTLERWTSRLGDTSVRIGPITTSIKGLATGVGLLGPLLFDLAGGAADIVGFLGSGIAGAAAVGSAGLAGFATSALGVGLVIKPMVKEFGEVKKAEEALTKAELKYGKGSEQVKTAQEQLNHELKGVSPIAKAAIQNYGKLGGEFAHLTSGAKPAVFDAFGQSLKTAQALLPEFASEATATTKVAASAWTGWMKALRSPGAKQALGEVMSNFRASIPGIAAGLGDIAAMFGHIAAAASHFLPGLSHGFAEWASNMEEAVGSGPKLVHTIGGMVTSMRDFGHLAQDSGSFLIHFFGDAVKPGQELNNSLDGTIKSWDKWAQSRHGEESLKKFFTESAGATKDFFSVLGGASKLLFEFSQATAPIANGLLKGVTAIGDLVSAADKLVGVKTIFQGIGVAMAGLWAVNKIKNFGSAIGDIVTSIGLVGGAEDAATASTAANTAALEANTAAMADNAAAADANAGSKGLAAAGNGVEDVAALGGGAAVAGDEAAAAAGGLTAFTAAAAILVPAAALIGIVAIMEGFKSVESRGQEAAKAIVRGAKDQERAIGGLITNAHSFDTAQSKSISTQEELLTARKKYIAMEKNGKTTQDQLTKQAQAIEAAEAKQTVTAGELSKQREQTVAGAKKAALADEHALKVAERGITVAHEEQAANQRLYKGGGRKGTENAQEAASIDAVSAARARAARSAAILTVATTNLRRESAGLVPVTDKTVEGLQHLQKTIGTAATKKIGNFVDPQAVARVTALSNQLTKLGKGSEVKKIDVKAGGAQKAEAELKKLQHQSNKITGQNQRLDITTNSQGAQAKLKSLSNTAQNLLGGSKTLKILADSSSATQAINQLHSELVGKITRTYKAELKAEDKSGQAASNFHHNLEGAAKGKYNAHLTAVDDATAKAKSAEGALKRVPKSVNARINVSSNAEAVASSAQQAMNAVENVQRSITITTNKVPGRGGAAGGMFAVGGQPDGGVMQRAAERAERQALKSSTFGAKVTKPTFLTGEEGATHPEYVIATNPSYRSSNEVYLEGAASALGKEVIPAHKTGKGAAPKKSGGSKSSGSGSSGDSSGPTAQEKKDAAYESALKNAPKKLAGKNHTYLHKEAFDAQGVHQINEEESNLQTQESEYSSLLAHEEQRLKHKEGPTHWEFGPLKNLKHKAYETNHNIIQTLIPNVITFARGEEDKAEKAYKQLGPEIAGAREATQAAKQEYTKASGKSTSKMTSKEKSAHAKDVATKKTAYTEQKAYEKKLIEERKHAKKIMQEAKEEINEIKHTRENTRIANNEIGLEESELDFYQANPEETPYYEAPEAGPTPEEQREENQQKRHEQYMEPKELALLEAENNSGLKATDPAKYAENIKNDKREVLLAAEGELAYARTTSTLKDDIEASNEVRSAAAAYEEASGAGAGGQTTTLGEETATASQARQNLYEQFASNVTSSPSPAYLPAGPAGTMFDTASSFGGTSPRGGSSGSITQVTNNFAAPPPDPHTWTKQQLFELNA